MFEFILLKNKEAYKSSWKFNGKIPKKSIHQKQLLSPSELFFLIVKLNNNANSYNSEPEKIIMSKSPNRCPIWWTMRLNLECNILM